MLVRARAYQVTVRCPKGVVRSAPRGRAAACGRLKSTILLKYPSRRIPYDSLDVEASVDEIYVNGGTGTCVLRAPRYLVGACVDRCVEDPPSYTGAMRLTLIGGYVVGG